MNVILIAAISADGKIAQREGQTSLDWTSKEDTQFFVSKTKEVGVLIMGRKTFETIGKPLKGRRIIVMTRGESGKGLGISLETGTVEFTAESPREILFGLAQEGCHGVVIAGGSSIYSAFLKEGLVNDVYLTVEPVLFGDGVSFVSGIVPIKMNLVEVIPLTQQTIVLHYYI